MTPKEVQVSCSQQGQCLAGSTSPHHDNGGCRHEVLLCSGQKHSQTHRLHPALVIFQLWDQSIYIEPEPGFCQSQLQEQDYGPSRQNVVCTDGVSLFVRVQLEPYTLLGINVEHWLQVTLVWKEAMKAWKLDLNNQECLIPWRVDFHNMLGNDRWLEYRKDFWYGPPVQVPPSLHLFGRHGTLLCSMSRRTRE